MMRPLLEYLISKENKKKVYFTFKKENLSSGDIICIKVKNLKPTYMIFGTRSEWSLLYSKQRFTPPKKDVFINATKYSISGKYLAAFNDDMTSNEPQTKVLAIYPGDMPKINDIHDLDNKFLENLTKDRNKIDIK